MLVLFDLLIKVMTNRIYSLLFITKLRFRTTVRDIPPFLLQRLGLEWTSMDLSGLSPKAPSAMISTNSGIIKDPGTYSRSPCYGAGEQNRFCRC